MLWSTAEAAVALMCACLPILRPLFTAWFVRSISRVQSKGNRSSMTFPTIAISQSCIDDCQIEDKVSQWPLRQDIERGYHMEDMNAPVTVRSMPVRQCDKAKENMTDISITAPTYF